MHPIKHHYIPAFYLKRWAGADGKLAEMRRFGARISSLRKHPNATGFKENLYRVEGVPEEQAQQFEAVFLKLLDTDADLALRKLESQDESPWDARLRSGWARFIMSLLFRNPEAVGVLRDHVVMMWKVAMEGLEELYAERKDPDDPETFEEYFVRERGGQMYADAANFLRGIIDNERIGQTIVEMNWSTVKLDKSDFTLLTSDRPLDMPLGLGDPKAYIALPIGPRLLFVAAHEKNFAASLRREKATHVARNANTAVVRQAREYVWAASDNQLTFVQRQISKRPDRIILDDAQKQAALDGIRNAPDRPAVVAAQSDEQARSAH